MKGAQTFKRQEHLTPLSGEKKLVAELLLHDYITAYEENNTSNPGMAHPKAKDSL